MSPDPVNTSPGVAAVLRELDSVHSTIREDREIVRADLLQQREIIKGEMAEFRAEFNDKLDVIVDEAKATNGRLRKVELVVGVGKALAAIAVALTPFALFYLNQVT